MFHVLIVEDEKIIREGFTRILGEYPELSVSAVRSSEEGLEILFSRHVDALLLDINLPGISGIDMLDQVRSHGLDDIVTIIISGHNEFGFAQRAIELQVHEYILKPVIPSRVREVAVLLVETLEKQKQHNAGLELMRQRFELAVPYIKEAFFREVMEQQEIDEAWEQRASLLGINLDGETFRVIIIKPRESTPADDAAAVQMMFHQVYETAQQYPWAFPSTCFYYTTRSIAVLQACGLPAGQIREDYDNLKKFPYLVRRETGISVELGIGEWVSPLQRVFMSFHQACDVLVPSGGDDLLGEGSCRFYRDLRQSTNDAHLELPGRELIQAAFESLDDQHLLAVLRQICMSSTGVSHAEVLEHICFLIQELLMMSRRYGVNGDDGLMQDLYSVFSGMSRQSVHEYYPLLCSAVLKAFRLVKELRSGRRNDIVQDVRTYIRKNYQQPILLASVAEFLQYSPNYLGAVFKKSTGKTIHEYWHSVRMEKARQLLKDQSMYIQEAASQVGYSDPYYFSTLFKQYFGVPPKEYRSR